MDEYNKDRRLVIYVMQDRVQTQNTPRLINLLI